jgi:hypothetical protein
MNDDARNHEREDTVLILPLPFQSLLGTNTPLHTQSLCMLLLTLKPRRVTECIRARGGCVSLR